MKRILLMLASASLLAACGISQRATAPSNSGSSDPKLPRMMGVDYYKSTRQSLLQAYRDWEGTPYLLGGSSERGVDCSMFVSIIFDDYFGIDLPTNTRKLMNAGDGVRRVSLNTGDLIFFRTGRRTLHVGIMVDDQEFLHASTSQGVMMSSLEETYWATRFFAARRVM